MKRPWPCLMTGTIVSFVNSPTAISSYRVRFLSPVVGNTNYTVKNSCEFVDFIRGTTLDAKRTLVSFDVISLFTKIPVDLPWDKDVPCPRKI